MEAKPSGSVENHPTPGPSVPDPLPADYSHPVTFPRGNIPELDGLRGLAILMVFLFHYVGLTRGTSWPAQLSAAVVKSLWCGVDLFFVLSGFLITGILLDTRGSRSYFRTFFARRALRIFPLYFGLLFVVFGVLPHVTPFLSGADQRLCRNQGWLWCYATNVKITWAGYAPFAGDRVWLHHLWSLAVEEHFYLVWPIVVYFCSTEVLRRVCLACVLGALVLRTGLLTTTALPLASYVATPCRIDALALGGLLALEVRRASTGRGRTRFYALVVMAGLALAGLLGWRGGLEAEDPAVRTVGYTLLALVATGLVRAALDLGETHPLRRGLRLRGLRTIGKYSYGLYVYHVALQPSLNALLTTEQVQASLVPAYWAAGLIRLALAFGACFGAAFLSWHAYERHFLSFKSFFITK